MVKAESGKALTHAGLNVGGLDIVVLGPDDLSAAVHAHSWLLATQLQIKQKLILSKSGRREYWRFWCKISNIKCGLQVP